MLNRVTNIEGENWLALKSLYHATIYENLNIGKWPIVTFFALKD